MAKATTKQAKAKQPTKAKSKVKAPVKTQSKAPEKKIAAQSNAKTGGMWKLLELKEQRLKLLNQGQQKHAGIQNGRSSFTVQNDHFSKFSGPRRRAA